MVVPTADIVKSPAAGKSKDNPLVIKVPDPIEAIPGPVTVHKTSCISLSATVLKLNEARPSLRQRVSVAPAPRLPVMPYEGAVKALRSTVRVSPPLVNVTGLNTKVGSLKTTKVNTEDPSGATDATNVSNAGLSPER